MMIALGLLLCAVVPTTRPADLACAVPHEAAVAILLDSPAVSAGPDAGSTSGWDLVAVLVRQARQVGFGGDLGADSRVLADVVGSLHLLSRYPTAAILLNVEAESLPGGGHRLRRLGGALVFAIGADPDPAARRVQELLNLYTDRSHSVMEQRSVDGLAVYRLLDDRLPGWVFEWGEVDGFFVVSVGAGSLERIVRAVRSPKKSLAEDSWSCTARKECRSVQPFLEIYLDADRLREQLGAIMEGTTREVLTALGMEELRRGYWAIWLDGRFVEACSFLRMADGDSRVPLTVSGPARRAWERFVPAQAGRAAVLAVSGADLLRRGTRAYLASRSASARQKWVGLWNQHVVSGDWSAESDFLDLLGETVILHDYPRHPLGIPLLCTVLVEIDGSAQAVRRSVDRILAAAQRALGSAASTAPSDPWAPGLRRDPDGVWYLQAGLLGPALAVTNGWIVISYAPDAVRVNLRQGAPRTRPPAIGNGNQKSEALPAAKPGSDNLR